MINAQFFFMCLKTAIANIPTNLILSAATFVISIVLGALMAMARVYKVPVLKRIIPVLLALGKALPTNLVLLVTLIIYTNNFKAITEFFGLDVSIKDVSLNYMAIVALVICELPAISEVIRSGLISVKTGQYEAGYSIGLTKTQTFFVIILPQVIKVIIPPLTNEILVLFKTTALVSVVGVLDIMNSAYVAAGTAYCYLEAYLAASLVFWAIGFLIEVFSRKVEFYFSVGRKVIA